MRYKASVLADYPDARLVTIDGNPLYQRVVSGPEGSELTVMDIHDQSSTYCQYPTAAWRSAYYWTVRKRNAKARQLEKDAAMERRYAGSTASRDPG